MSRSKSSLILFLDIIAFWAALFLTLFVRYGQNHQKLNIQIQNHLVPFSFILIIWIAIFYLFDLYRQEKLKFDLGSATVYAKTMLINLIVAILFLYVFLPIFKLTPRANLIFITVAYSIFSFSARATCSKIFGAKGLKSNVAFFGTSNSVKELKNFISQNPQFGYTVMDDPKIPDIKNTVKSQNIKTLIIHPQMMKDINISQNIYDLLPLKISIINFANFYEKIFKKVPLEDIEKGWFIEHIISKRFLYDAFKRMFDVLGSIIIGIIFSPIIIIIAVLTKFSSRKGPVIFKQIRIGADNIPFTLYKFGIMKEDKGSPWTAQNDERLTSLGKFINQTHLNELPQLWNILKGDISFIGPRPESMELSQQYKILSYYEIRQIIKPGLTGWAQVNYKPSNSIEEANEKLKFDMYYIKNRSLILDALIIIKTIKYFFTSLK